MGAPPAAPKFLPPHMGAQQQLVSGPDPPFPPSLATAAHLLACWSRSACDERQRRQGHVDEGRRLVAGRGRAHHRQDLAVRPAARRTTTRFPSVTPPRSSSSRTSNGPKHGDRARHGLHTGRTLERDGPRRARRSSSCWWRCRCTRSASRASACATFGAGASSRASTSRRSRRMVEAAGRLREAVGLDKRFAGSPVAQRHRRRARRIRARRRSAGRGRRAVRGRRGRQPRDGTEQGARAGQPAPRPARAGDGRVVGAVRRPVRHRRRHHHRVPEAGRSRPRAAAASARCRPVSPRR